MVDGGKTLVEALKNPLLSSSRLIKLLRADSKVPTVAAAIKLIETHGPIHESFHTPRHVDKGAISHTRSHRIGLGILLFSLMRKP